MFYKVIHNSRISEAYSEEELYSFALRGYLKGHMVLIDVNGNRSLAKDLFPDWFGEYADFTSMDSDESESGSENLWTMEGSDGKIYGPYTIEMLRSFIGQRRITPSTKLFDRNGNIIRAGELLDFGSANYSENAFYSENSGHGKMSRLPYELKGLNWGACFLPLFWGISHNVWWGILALFPAFRFVISLILLFKGNEWAWQSRKFSSKEEFVQVQKIWRNWGLGFLLLCFLFGVCFSYLL